MSHDLYPKLNCQNHSTPWSEFSIIFKTWFTYWTYQRVITSQLIMSLLLFCYQLNHILSGLKYLRKQFKLYDLVIWLNLGNIKINFSLIIKSYFGKIEIHENIKIKQNKIHKKTTKMLWSFLIVLNPDLKIAINAGFCCVTNLNLNQVRSANSNNI